MMDRNKTVELELILFAVKWQALVAVSVTPIYFGKVVGAKVVTNARSPGARCYGFVTMSTADEATKCITHLHKTELHGKIISVEKVSTDAQSYPVTISLYK